jgi:hypothetical protein
MIRTLGICVLWSAAILLAGCSLMWQILLWIARRLYEIVRTTSR